MWFSIHTETRSFRDWNTFLIQYFQVCMRQNFLCRWGKGSGSVSRGADISKSELWFNFQDLSTSISGKMTFIYLSFKNDLSACLILSLFEVNFVSLFSPDLRWCNLSEITNLSARLKTMTQVQSSCIKSTYWRVIHSYYFQP